MAAQLPPDELKRRIAAARTLRGVEQADLQRTLADDGLGRRELGRIERGELPLTRARRIMLADALRVPEEWFTAEDADDLVAGDAPGALRARLDALEDQLNRIEALLAARDAEALTQHEEALSAIRAARPQMRRSGNV